jgi:cardiolipin synthase A/B
VRVFAWNGSMLHAKTAVADGRWARVGSTNLNPASWLGNCELDVIVEDDTSARHMETMYIEDMTDATEVILDERPRSGDAPGRLICRRPVAGEAPEGQPRAFFASATGSARR